MRIDESLINAHTLTGCNIFANQSCIGKYRHRLGYSIVPKSYINQNLFFFLFVFLWIGYENTCSPLLFHVIKEFKNGLKLVYTHHFIYCLKILTLFYIESVLFFSFVNDKNNKGICSNNLFFVYNSRFDSSWRRQWLFHEMSND